MVLVSSVTVIRHNNNVNCWQQKTYVQKTWIIVLPSFVLVTLSIFLYLLLTNRKEIIYETNFQNWLPSNANPLNETTCFTPGCIKAANKILEYADRAVDPCENFYDFACGGYKKGIHVSYDDAEHWDVFSELEALTRKRLKTLFGESETVKNKPRYYELINRLYANCMNETSKTLNEIDTVNAMLKDMGGWPVLEGYAWNDKKFYWQRSIYKFRKYGLNTDSFISFNIVQDPQNSSNTILQLNKPNVDSLLFIQNNTILEAYAQYLTNLAVLFGAERKYAEDEVRTVITFRQTLAKITLVNEDKNITSIAQLQKNHPHIYWLDLINSAVSLPDDALRHDDLVILSIPDYVTKLEGVLRNTSKRTQANHAIFQAIVSLVPYMSEKFREVERQFQFAKSGISTTSLRWKECVDVVLDTLNLAVGSMYVKRYVKDNSKHQVIELISKIKHEFIQIVEKLRWLEQSVKAKTITKINSMTILVGYPEELLDEKHLEQYYEDLKINTSDNYLHFVGNLSLFQRDKSIEGLFRSTKKNIHHKLYVNPTVVNVLYYPEDKTIEIPIALLQDTFFNNDGLYSTNFGGVGTIVGRKIAEIINDIFDSQQAKKKSHCFQLPEDYEYQKILADSLGLKLVYLSYDSWIKANEEELLLPGFNYTARQNFWISQVHTLCSKELHDSQRSSSEKLSNRARTLLLLRNSKNFQQDFRCTLKSYMNPVDKCDI